MHRLNSVICKDLADGYISEENKMNRNARLTRRKFLQLSALTGTGLIAVARGTTVSAAGASSFIDPTAVITGDVRIGNEDYIAPFTQISAKGNFFVEMKDRSNFQDNEVISADGKNLSMGERATVAHGATVLNSTLGKFTFVGFNSRIENATLEDGAFVAHGVRITGVTIPKDKFVPTGSVIDNAAQVASLPSVTQANIDFKNEVIEVNEEFAHGYGNMVKQRGADSVKRVGPSPLTTWNKRYIQPVLGAGVNIAQNVRIIGNVSLGANSSVGNKTSIRADEGNPIIIGDGAQIGEEVTFHALKHQTIGIGKNLKAGKHVVVHGTITLGDNVSLGDGAVVFNSTIGSNITIGKGALVVGVKLGDGANVPDGKVVTEQSVADSLAPANAKVTSAPLPAEGQTAGQLLPTTGGAFAGEREGVLAVSVLALLGAALLLAGAIAKRTTRA